MEHHILNFVARTINTPQIANLVSPYKSSRTSDYKKVVLDVAEIAVMPQ